MRLSVVRRLTDELGFVEVFGNVSRLDGVRRAEDDQKEVEGKRQHYRRMRHSTLENDAVPRRVIVLPAGRQNQLGAGEDDNLQMAAVDGDGNSFSCGPGEQSRGSVPRPEVGRNRGESPHK